MVFHGQGTVLPFTHLQRRTASVILRPPFKVFERVFFTPRKTNLPLKLSVNLRFSLSIGRFAPLLK